MSLDMKKPEAATSGSPKSDHLAGRSSATVPDSAPARQLLAANPFGLTRGELHAEIRRRMAGGWQLWEIRVRFAPGGEVAA